MHSISVQHKMLALMAMLAATSAIAATFRQGPSSEAQRGWLATGRAEGDRKIDMVFGLALQNTDKLEENLYAVSTPGNPRYLQHMTQQEIRELTAPSAEAVVAVDSWIQSANLTGAVTSDAELLREGFIRMSLTVDQAEQLLSCKYEKYADEHGHEILRVGSSGFSIPDEVAEHVPVIEPTSRFPATHRGPLLRSTPINGGITPSDVRSAYGISGPGAKGKSSKNRVAIASFLGQFWSQKDLDTFWKDYSPDSAGNDPTVLGPNVGNVRDERVSLVSTSWCLLDTAIRCSVLCILERPSAGCVGMDELQRGA